MCLSEDHAAFNLSYFPPPKSYSQPGQAEELSSLQLGGSKSLRRNASIRNSCLCLEKVIFLQRDLILSQAMRGIATSG